MPVRNTEVIITYPIFDAVTGAYTADAASNHTYELLADGVEVAVTDTGSTTTVTGWNQVTIASDENTGVMMSLKITTSTSGVKIPAIAWDNSLAEPTVAQIADGVWDEVLSGHASAGTGGAVLQALTIAAISDGVWDEALSGHATSGTAGANLSAAGAAADPWSTALPGSYTSGQAGYILSEILTDTAAIGTTINVINVPLVAYNGTVILNKDDSYDGTLNPTVTFGSLLVADISGATAHIEITSEKDGAGTVYYSASNGSISGSSGAWTVAYSIPTTGTDDLPIGVEVAYYHAWVTDSSSVATVGKGRVTVR